jgi:hypothetical protein
MKIRKFNEQSESGLDNYVDDEKRILLNADDFEILVSGGELYKEDEKVKIILSDIGYEEMIKIIKKYM